MLPAERAPSRGGGEWGGVRVHLPPPACKGLTGHPCLPGSQGLVQAPPSRAAPQLFMKPTPHTEMSKDSRTSRPLGEGHGERTPAKRLVPTRPSPALPSHVHSFPVLGGHREQAKG